MAHKEQCECFNCQFKRAKQAEMQETEGWYPDFKSPDPLTPMNFNFHTHGFPEKFGQPDIQICFPMPLSKVQMITEQIIGGLLKPGIKIKSGVMYDQVLEGYNVQFVEAIEDNRTVHRIILPDKNGRFDTHPYCHQFEMLLYNFENNNQA